MMKLPVIESPTYTMNLISTGEEITYRPYTVKQEKILLIALESRDIKQIINAIFDVLEQCVDRISPRSLPQYEIENLFLNLRSKSVGETVNLSLKCDKCEAINSQSVELLQFKMEGEINDPKIMISDTMGVMMKHPSIDDLKEFLEEDQATPEFMIKVVSRSIDYIFDDEQIFKREDVSEEDLISFIESLNTVQYRDMLNYVNNVPKLSQDISFDCEKCQEHNEVKLEGLQSFFM